MARSRKAYDRVIELLGTSSADFRTLDHPRERSTNIVSSMLGCDRAAFVESAVVMVKTSKNEKVYVLAAIPSDRQVDFGAIRAMRGGSYAGPAHPDIARRLSGCASGTEVPFSWDADLVVVVDPLVYDHDEIYFPAGRPDRAVALVAEDHRRIVQAAEHSISKESSGPANPAARPS